MKKLISVFTLCAIIAAMVAGCGAKRQSAQVVTESAIKCVKNRDMDAIQYYWGENAFTIGDAEEDDKDAKEVMDLIISGLAYQILSAKEDADAGTATVSVEFTNVDMAQVLSEILSDMFSEATVFSFSAGGQQSLEEKMEKLFMEKFKELMSEKDLETITATVDIPLSLVDGEWKIEPNEEVADAMLGGLISYMDSLDGMS